MKNIFLAFSDSASGVLYDVTIINDTLAYTAGGMRVKNSLGNWDPVSCGFCIFFVVLHPTYFDFIEILVTDFFDKKI